MKVRFYRGPWDGKVKQVAPNTGNYLFVTLPLPGPLWSNPQPTNPTLSTEKHIYRRTNHTHPDGSVYYEWDKPKGTKWRTEPKPKKSRFVPGSVVAGGGLHFASNNAASYYSSRVAQPIDFRNIDYTP